MATISMSDVALDKHVRQQAEKLLGAGYSSAGVEFCVSAKQLEALGLNESILSFLLTTGLASAPRQKGIVHSYGVDKRSGEVCFSLNYDLQP